HCLSEEFRTDLATVIDWSRTARCILMCSEAVWWRCHRRLIADHLLARHLPVSHVLGPGHIDAAKLSGGAAVDPDGVLTSPANGTGCRRRPEQKRRGGTRTRVPPRRW